MDELKFQDQAGASVSRGRKVEEQLIMEQCCSVKVVTHKDKEDNEKLNEHS